MALPRVCAVRVAATTCSPHSKHRYFCPSCHQKRVVLFAERVEQEVLEKVPVRQYVVTISTMLRIFFKRDRKLLGLLSRCFQQTLKQFPREASPGTKAVPGWFG